MRSLLYTLKKSMMYVDKLSIVCSFFVSTKKDKSSFFLNDFTRLLFA